MELTKVIVNDATAIYRVHSKIARVWICIHKDSSAKKRNSDNL